MSSNVQKIKEKLGITEVVQNYIKVERAGKNFKARCPFHNEKTPSFFISPDRGSYYCFGCGAKGDIFSFVSEFEGVDFVGALKILADKANVELVYENNENRTERDQIFQILSAALDFFISERKKNIKVTDYLILRGLSEKTIEDWSIGYAPNTWDSLIKFLKPKYGESLLEKAGLAKRGEKGFYDRFRGRIIFPIEDSAGRVVGFTGRAFESQDEAKYLNSPETPVFDKSSILYGLSKAKTAIREMGYALLVEGQIDLILSHQVGIRNAIATSGTSMTDTHAKIIKRFTDKLMVAYDADKAGVNASLRAWSVAVEEGLDIKIALLPKGKDPADLAKDNKELLIDSLKNARHIVDFSLDTVLQEEKDQRKIGEMIRKVVLPIVSLIDSAIDKDHFIKRISLRTNIPEKALWDDLAKVKMDDKSEKNREEQKSLKKDSVYRKIFGVILWAKKEKNDKESQLEQIALKSGLKDFELSDSDKDSMLFETENYYGDLERALKDFDELCLRYEMEGLRNDTALLMTRLSRAEKDGGGDDTLNILKEIQDKTKRIEEISRKLESS